MRSCEQHGADSGSIARATVIALDESSASPVDGAPAAVYARPTPTVIRAAATPARTPLGPMRPGRLAPRSVHPSRPHPHKVTPYRCPDPAPTSATAPETDDLADARHSPAADERPSPNTRSSRSSKPPRSGTI